MKKKYLTLIIFSLFSQILFSQTVQDELNKLFFDLNLELKFNEIVSKSNQNFEFSEETDSITNVTEKIYTTSFTEHPLIQSKILIGYYSIRQAQKEKDLKKEKYGIDAVIKFQTQEEVITEYKKLSLQYEKFGYSIKERTVKGENEDIGYQNKVISIETKTKSIDLTFLYIISGEEKTEYDLYIACSYQNLLYK